MMIIIAMIKKISDINFISKVKQNITERRKRKSTKDNNKFGDNATSKEKKSNSKFKPKTNVFIHKND